MKRSKVQYNKYFVKIRFTDRETGEENVNSWFVRCEALLML